MSQEEHCGAGPIPLELNTVRLEEGLVGDDLTVLKVGVLEHLGEAGPALRPGDIGHDVEALGGALGHAVVGHLRHVDLVGDGLEAVVLVELNLVVDHPGADLLLTAPLGTPPGHFLLEETLHFLPGLDVPEVKVGLGLLALDDGVLLPGGQEGASRGPGETANLQSVAVIRIEEERQTTDVLSLHHTKYSAYLGLCNVEHHLPLALPKSGHLDAVHVGPGEAGPVPAPGEHLHAPAQVWAEA